ncbi:MAG: serine hydrolase domain-containing protein [Gemmatimonas sp.]
MNRRDFLITSAAASSLSLAKFDITRVNAASHSVADAFGTAAAVVEEEMARLKIPGVALGVFKDGVFTHRGFGVTNIENPQPIDENTIFSLASISKTVTATAVMSLVQQGKLNLDSPVRTWLPNWSAGGEDSSRAMLLRHLVTHSTGLNGPVPVQDVGVETLTRFAESMQKLNSLAPPGAVWSYLNAGFALAGRIVEVAAATDIHRAFRQLVFTPLGLVQASTRLDQIATRRLAVGHQPGANGAPTVIRTFTMGSTTPSGGVAMGIAELMRFAAFHLNDGPAKEAPVITPQNRAVMRQPQVVKAPTDDWMGIGWHLRKVGGVMTATHGGTAVAGHRLLLELVPERRLAFAVLTNHTDGWRLNQKVEKALLKAYENLELTPNQHIAYRGINEDLSAHTTPLSTQPKASEYIGNYLGDTNPIVVGVANGRIVVGVNALNFYAPDLAFSAQDGTPVEFIRNDAGIVTWIRVGGQGFARKAG